MMLGQYGSLVLVACIAAFTPGPNNTMLLHSGMLFGFKKTVPHITGILVGFSLLFFFGELWIDNDAFAIPSSRVRYQDNR